MIIIKNTNELERMKQLNIIAEVLFNRLNTKFVISCDFIITQEHLFEYEKLFKKYIQNEIIEDFDFLQLMNFINLFRPFIDEEKIFKEHIQRFLTWHLPSYIDSYRVVLNENQYNHLKMLCEVLGLYEEREEKFKF